MNQKFKTRRTLTTEAELADVVKKYNPEILAKRLPTREASAPIDIPNHANHFQESDPA